MNQAVVKASVGRERGTRPSRRLRRQGDLPGVIYGLDKEPQVVSVGYVALRDALNNPFGMNTLIKIDVDGASETVLCRDLQRDPLKRTVTHADFLRVDLGKPVRVKVPVELVGDGTKVTSTGALIEQKRFELEIEALPESIPEKIEADISLMTVDRRLAVSDLVFPDGVSTRVPENISIASPVVSRAAKMLTAAEEDLEAGELDGESVESSDDEEAEASSSEE